MKIDIKTIILIIGIFRLILIMVFSYQYVTARRVKGPGWWLAWSIAEAFSAVLMLLRSLPGLLPVIIILQNPVIVAGSFFIYTGILKFLEQKVNMKFLVAGFLSYFVLHLFFHFIFDNAEIRTALLYLGLFINFVLATGALLKKRSRSISLTANFVAVFLLMHISMCAVRIVMLLLGIKSPSMFESSPVSYLIYFDALVVSLLMAFSFIVMVNQRLNSELSELNEKLGKINAEKDKLFSIIAHDLISPFNVFLGMTSLMAEKDPGSTIEDYRKQASLLHSTASGLYNLLGDLLEWSRMQRGLIPWEPQNLELSQLAEKGLASVAGNADIKGVAIINNIPAGIYVYSDSGTFQTVLRNLVSNAIKFTPRGGKIILSASSVNNNMVEISVRDTGIGMNQELTSGLFRIDSKKVNRKGTEGEGGTGLGLVICSDLIEKGSGTIRVESEQGKGSEFIFTVRQGSGNK